MKTELKSRSGFTLVELLIVVAIIAALMAILLPSIGAARRQAKKVVCQTHLREIGRAFIMYAQEEDGWIAFSLPWDWDSHFTSAASLRMWCGWRDSYTLTQQGTFRDDDSLLSRYIPNQRKVMDCPVLSEMSVALYAGGTNAATSVQGQNPAYGGGLNLTFSYACDVYHDDALKLSRVTVPADTFLIGDCAQYSTSASGAQITRSIYVHETYGSAIEPSFHGRHNGYGNVLWFDGHVTQELASPSAGHNLSQAPFSSAVYDSYHLGFLKRSSDSYSSADSNYYFFLDKVEKNIVPQ